MSEAPPPSIEATHALAQHLTVPRESRDPTWYPGFFAALADAALATVEQQVLTGPDSFNYFVLHVPESGASFSPFSIRSVLDQLLENGLGVVLNPTDNTVDWVVTFGQLWTLKVTGRFDPPNNEPEPTETADPNTGRQILTGAPTEAFFPGFARAALRRHFQNELGMAEPKMCLIADPTQRPSQSLVFNLHPESFEKHEDYVRAMERLRWFLPDAYGLASVPRETTQITSAFLPL